MDEIFKWDGVAVCSALLDLAETLAGREALPELLEAPEEKKLRSAVKDRPALLQLVGGSALSELLGPAEAGRFMATQRKMQS